MSFQGFPVEALDFYEGLESDNTKTYWTAHKKIYDECVRAPLVALCEALEPEFGESHLFRPYNDLRFAKDRSPYKEQQGAVVGDHYLHVSAAGLFAASGYHQMASDQVDRYRQAVDDKRTGGKLERVVGKIRSQGVHRRRRCAEDTAARLPGGPSADRAASAQGAGRVDRIRVTTMAAHRRCRRPGGASLAGNGAPLRLARRERRAVHAAATLTGHRMGWPEERASIRRDALGIAAYAGAFGVSLGAIAVASGLTVMQTCLLSLAMFSGASQVAFIGVIGAGGSALAAIPATLLLGIRNTFYGIRLVQVLGVRGRRVAVAAQFVLDETAAMVIARDDEREKRYAFWFTGVLLFVVWNVGTIAGALGGSAIGDTAAFGLDAVVTAAFLALIWPRLDDATSRLVAIGGALVAVTLVPLLPPGIPVLAAAPVAVVVGLWRREPRSAT